MFSAPNKKIANIIALLHGAMPVSMILATFMWFFGVAFELAWLAGFAGAMFIAVLAMVLVGNVLYPGDGCPMTALEKHYRDGTGIADYDGGFISYYAGKLGVDVSDSAVNLMMSLAGWTIALFVSLWLLFWWLLF